MPKSGKKKSGKAKQKARPQQQQQPKKKKKGTRRRQQVFGYNNNTAGRTMAARPILPFRMPTKCITAEFRDTFEISVGSTFSMVAVFAPYGAIYANLWVSTAVEGGGSTWNLTTASPAFYTGAAKAACAFEGSVATSHAGSLGVRAEKLCIRMSCLSNLANVGGDVYATRVDGRLDSLIYSATAATRDTALTAIGASVRNSSVPIPSATLLTAKCVECGVIGQNATAFKVLAANATGSDSSLLDGSSAGPWATEYTGTGADVTGLDWAPIVLYFKNATGNSVTFSVATEYRASFVPAATSFLRCFAVDHPVGGRMPRTIDPENVWMEPGMAVASRSAAGYVGLM